MSGPQAALTGKPREKSGPKTIARYDFQVHVSILRVLDLFEGDEPFMALFDHHDDLVLLVGPLNSEQMSFLQIKTREKAWKLSDLLSRPKSAEVPKSILGKMYHNALKFGDHVKEARFVSNSPIHLTLSDGEKTGIDDEWISFQKLSEADHKKIVKALEADFGSPLGLDYKNTLSFERVPLDLASFRLTVKGRVGEFLEARGLDSGAAGPVYTAIHSVLMQKTGNSVTCHTPADLRSRKALDRDGLAELLTRAAQRAPTVVEWWPVLQPDIETFVDGPARLSLRRRCIAYWSARTLAATHATMLSEELRLALSLVGDLSGIHIKGQLTVLMAAVSGPDEYPPTYDLMAAALVELAEVMGG